MKKFFTAVFVIISSLMFGQNQDLNKENLPSKTILEGVVESDIKKNAETPKQDEPISPPNTNPSDKPKLKAVLSKEVKIQPE
jgi:hypothetical protein